MRRREAKKEEGRGKPTEKGVSGWVEEGQGNKKCVRAGDKASVRIHFAVLKGGVNPASQDL